MNYKLRTKNGFTLIELVVAVAILAMVLSFAGLIFKVSIDAYRTATANTEIMQKLRAITDQLNRDFKGLQKDGYLILHSEEITRREFKNSPSPDIFRADRLYYFSTGDFQSWFDPDIRSNIARVYFGHDSISLYSAIPRLVSEWNLARDIVLLTPEVSVPPPPPVVDYNDVSYAVCKVDLGSFENPFDKLDNPVQIDTLSNPPTNPQCLMCQNAGAMQIEWTDGTKYPAQNNSLAWFGFSMPRYVGSPPDIPPIDYGIEIKDIAASPPYYRAFWTPVTPKQLWPKALKFTFTLYDSKGTLKGGRTFTHIVYLGN